MRLKIVVTACVITGIILMLGLPFVFKMHPGEHADRKALAAYGLRVLGYISVTCAAWLSAAFGSALLLKKTKIEFAEKRTENLRQLVEGSLRDHEPKS